MVYPHTSESSTTVQYMSSAPEISFPARLFRAQQVFAFSQRPFVPVLAYFNFGTYYAQYCKHSMAGWACKVYRNDGKPLMSITYQR